jgi:hypothetical protein
LSRSRSRSLLMCVPAWRPGSSHPFGASAVELLVAQRERDRVERFGHRHLPAVELECGLAVVADADRGCP